MSVRSYKLTVVACALSWLMVGLHAGVFHQIIHHKQNPGWLVLAAVAVVILIGLATLAALLRAAPGGTQPPLGPSSQG